MIHDQEPQTATIALGERKRPEQPGHAKEIMLLLFGNFNQYGLNTLWYDFVAIGEERKIFGKIPAKPILAGSNF